MLTRSSTHHTDGYASDITNVLGIASDHPEIKHAFREYRTFARHSLVLFHQTENRNHPWVYRITDDLIADFAESATHDRLVQSIKLLHPKIRTDKEIFLAALHGVMVRCRAYAPEIDDLIPDTYQKNCFQLVFAYTAGNYCIAAHSRRSPDGRNMHFTYGKFPYPHIPPIDIYHPL